MKNLSTIRNQIVSGAYDSVFLDIYGDAFNQRTRYTELIDRYIDEFGDTDGASLFSSPGRTEIGGNHTDHQRGCVLAACVSVDAAAVAAPNSERVIRIVSEGFKTDEIWLSDIMPNPDEKGTSAALIRGIAAKFTEMGCTVKGFNAVVSSGVLQGSGLSSSAAFEVLLCCMINTFFAEGQYTPFQLANISRFAENNFFGKPCGLMDQMACASGGAVFIDFADSENPYCERIDIDLDRYGYRLCIIDTGGNHTGLTEEYAAIPAEMRAVARYFGKQSLSDISAADMMDNIPELRRKLGDRAITRSIHFFMETERARLEADALKRGNFSEFLRLINESGQSSFMYLQNIFSSHKPEEQPVSVALALCEYYLEGRGACRVHGGGFAGTIQAFVPADMLDSFREKMESALEPECCHVLTIRAHGAREICI